MGLQDRDYMRERNRSTFADRPFTPPPERSSILSMVLGWLAIAFILYKAYGWWHEQQQRERSARILAKAAEAQAAAERRKEWSAAPAHTPPAPAPARIERPQPPAARTEVRQQSPAPTGGTIYLCRAYDGGSFWAQAHCHQHKALIDSIASVPAGIPFEQQVQIAQQRRQASQRALAVETALPSPAPVAQNRAECRYLDKRVEELDALARQPQSAAMQDWNRAERHKARDRQFALRC